MIDLTSKHPYDLHHGRRAAAQARRSLLAQRRDVWARLQALHALPYSCRSDYWYTEYESRLQVSYSLLGMLLNYAAGKPLGGVTNKERAARRSYRRLIQTLKNKTR